MRHHRLYRIVPGLFLVCGFPLALGLASAPPEPAKTTEAVKTPEEVVALYFERVKTDGLGSVADLMHPDELRKFRDMMAPVIEAALAENDDTYILFADPDDKTRMRPFDELEFMSTFMDWVGLEVPGLAQALRNSTIQTIGHVVEGDVKHVVVRSKLKTGELEIEKMTVWSVKDFEGEPRLLLTGDMKGLAATLKRKR